MRYAAITDRLTGLGGAKWAVHNRAHTLAAQGRAIIDLTIGNPDVRTPPDLIAAATRAMQAGRTTYSNGQGEADLLQALADDYTARRGRTILPAQIMCFPGTQTALYAVLMTLAGPGDQVLAADPMYATYEGLIAATGAEMVPVPLRPDCGFRLQAADLAERITPASRVIFLNSPHNPTGAVLTSAEIADIGALAVRHNLWLLCDEVYEDLVFAGTTFASPLEDSALADRVIVASSISKSHAAPGFRSGWCVGPEDFISRLLPLSETMLFGNQPFIADMTAQAVRQGSLVAEGMVQRFARRADLVSRRLHGVSGMQVHRPDAGMFALVNIGAIAADSEAFAMALLEKTGVAVMPGTSFGTGLTTWLRLSLTQPDEVIEQACSRIAAFASGDRP